MTADRVRMAALTPEDPKRLGPHRLVGRIGAGGMGTVYAARGSAGGYIAVKMIHGEHVAEPGFRARFAREVHLLQRVRSTSVPSFISADPDGATPWLATEFVAGSTLQRHVQEAGPLPPGLLLALAAGVAEALLDIHDAGIAHRDLKPGNVILSADGPKVLDFGIARAAEDTGLTATGGVVGTPGWISPEQYEGHPATSRSDVFALGGLIAFAATGRNPFGFGAANVLAFRTIEDPPDLLGVPEQLAAVIAAAMAKNPPERPAIDALLPMVHRLWSGDRADSEPSGALLAELLDRHWRGLPTSPPAPPAPPRHRRLLMVGAPVAAALLTAGGLGVPTALGTAPWSKENGGNSGVGRNASTSTAPEPSRSLPPEAVAEAVNGSDYSRVQLKKGLPTIEANSGERTGYTVTVKSVEELNDGLRFSAEVAFWSASPQINSDQLTLRKIGGGHIPPSNPEPLTAEGFSPTRNFDLIYPTTEESGLITFTGGSYKEGELGNPPVSFCFEVGGDFSLDYHDCT
ncbi:serine/threonine protein kinase [Murinocardiopsis flavida]|uniref:Serine/threonine protein kinase n=1 Tax=Murinocardiopsis flavida TaxID=645275 RepID=A0A2P8DJ99_9ACTN|nr:serine/threonine-protein kinase [Murinocardiopsis flavida]PSK97300.1 serine/threonine protein kinase [Murinocardiopsis flavida]